jgi:putative FmdB family regulatory protein
MRIPLQSIFIFLIFLSAGGFKMPIYEYECTQCGKVEEVLQKFSDQPLTTCRNCSGSLHKLVSQSSFHLKGSGWYVTDYAGKSGSSAPKTKETTSSETASPGESKKSDEKTS